MAAPRRERRMSGRSLTGKTVLKLKKKWRGARHGDARGTKEGQL
jgi:hypothetical protein